MKKTIMLTSVLLSTLISSCEFKNEFKPINSSKVSYSFGLTPSLNIYLREQANNKVRVAFSVSAIKQNYHIDSLSIQLRDEHGHPFSLLSVNAFDGMKPGDLTFHRFADVPDSILTLTPAIEAYYAYDHIFAVNHVSAEDRYIVTITGKISSGKAVETIHRTLTFERSKHLKLSRLVC